MLVLQFSDNFAILLFHYDGRVTEWDEFEWSKRAIHISVRKQTKWYVSVSNVLIVLQLLWNNCLLKVCLPTYTSRWYAKRFLHPDIVSAYEYIFIWDEDLGVEHFNAEEYAFILLTSSQCFLAWLTYISWWCWITGTLSLLRSIIWRSLNLD